MDLRFLQQRLSVSSKHLGTPGPDTAQLHALLSASLRVPDHGKLNPFRLLLIRGDAGPRLGEALAAIHSHNTPDATAATLEKDRARFTHAPVIVVVIATIDTEQAKIPAQEQLLSAGCVAYNLLLGAQSLGFGAQWLTGWAAYDATAAKLLGLESNEKIVGFVHIGTVLKRAHEGERPALPDFVRDWGE